LQLRAQFWTIHACAAPEHWPCADHVGHVVCESAPQLLVADGGITVGVAVAMKTGAAVRGGVTAVAQAGLQLRAQFWTIHACAAPVH
jgi:hypothetical protein